MRNMEDQRLLAHKQKQCNPPERIKFTVSAAISLYFVSINLRENTECHDNAHKTVTYSP